MAKTARHKRPQFYLLAPKKKDLRKGLLEDLGCLALEVGTSATDEGLYTADVIMLYIVNDVDGQWGLEAVNAIKAQPRLFLKPLLALSERHLEGLEGVVDEEIILPVQPDVLQSKTERLLSISRKIKGLAGVQETLSKSMLSQVLLLQFLYTRDNYPLKPRRDIDSSLGYSYPLAQSLLNGSSGTEVEVLDGLERLLLLKWELEDKINLCPFCQHFQINFREICPDCRSMMIKEEAAIHHFRCAYVGKDADFREGPILRCPKCRKELRHIGVDYDRPSEDLWCASCGSNFYETTVQCKCINCGKQFPPEETRLKYIKSYTLTPEGQTVAESGVLTGLGLMNILRGEVDLYKYDVFKELYRLEVLRCRRYNYDSSLALVTMKNFGEILDTKGITYAHMFTKEFATIFRQTFRETDILTELNDNEFLALCTNCGNVNVMKALERLREKSSSVFKAKLDLDYNILDLRGETEDLDSILEKSK
ncbi:MAG: diguanylate cyclase [Candidatus Brocadiales bacterium]